MHSNDTIAAISTAMSESGIGIIRISGDDALAVADQVYRAKNKKKKLSDQPSHTIHYGCIFDKEEMVDEVLVSILRAPRSFTAEDTVEINCHGGVYAMRRVLETVLKNGARLAQPGEFTKRAFLNGRIDLSQAEAVIDVITAKNEYALKSSLSQLKGSIQEAIRSLRSEILYHLAKIESALDDPEHISLEGYPSRLSSMNEKWMSTLSRLIASSENGRIIKEGIQTVIVGKPNAGKSSLLNLLIGEDRAIVTDIAGTTRDVLTETINLGGVTLNIVDTAGIRDTDDLIEKIGVEKTKEYVEKADLIIFVVDASTCLDENDEEIIHLIQYKKSIVLQNKTDLNIITTEETLREKIGQAVILPVSAREQTGLDLLETTIKEMFYQGNLSFNDEIYITNVRHKNLLIDALESLKQVKQSIAMNMPEDFFSIDLMNAYESLGEITGEKIGEDLVNEIFSKFCMGK